jgi:hypothetical protein
MMTEIDASPSVRAIPMTASMLAWLLGHISNLSFGSLMVRTSEWRAKAADNGKIFVAKLGQAIFDEMQTGYLWQRLHCEQDGR